MVLGHDIQTELDGQMDVGHEQGETPKTLALFVTIKRKYIVCSYFAKLLILSFS